MANYKQQAVGYQPFESKAILDNGLLAVARPHGEVAAALSQAMFGAADLAGQEAERIALKRGQDRGLAAGQDANPTVNVSGGEQTTTVTAGSSPVAAPSNVRDVIAAAAARHGVSPHAMLKVAQIESGFNPSAKNKTSSAGGLYQQTDDNAVQYAVMDRFNAIQSADGAARFMRDNTNYLMKKLNRAPTVGELYLAHQQGPGGAARLLSNPNASAVSVVGRKAVLLNGGTEDMTAGQFAKLWTDKAGNADAGPGFGPMPQVDFTPDTVTHGRDPLVISGGSGDLHLTGRDTIFGRAYDKAATDAYQSQLQDEMLTASSQLFDKFGDDPEGLQQAFETLKTAQLNDHVPPQILGDYEHAFSRVQRNYMARAQAGREKQIKTQQQDEWFGRASKFEEGLGRAQVGLDPSNAQSFDVMQGEANRLKQHYRDGVARGIITPKQAADATSKLDSDVAANWYTQQAQGKTPDEINTLRDHMKADYVAGKMPGVDAQSWNRIDAQLQSVARDAGQELKQKSSKLVDLSQSILDRAALGYDIAPTELNAFRSAATGVERGDEIVSSTLSVLDTAHLLRDDPVGSAEAKLADLKVVYGKAPTPQQVALIETTQGMISKARQSLATDLLSHAERAGVIDDAGSFADIKSAGDVQQLIAARIGSAQKAATHFGVDEQYFKPGEVKALEGIVLADPEQGAAIAGAIIQGAGTRTAAVLKEFGKTAPMLAGAGAIIADGGDVTAARDAIAGGGKDENGKAYSQEGWKARRTLANEVAGAALVFQQADQTRIMDTAERIARKRIADAGVEATSPEADEITKRAVNEAAGAVFSGDVQYGGFANFDPWYTKSGGTVAVPNYLRADRLADVIDAVRPDDLVVQPMGGLDAMQSQMPILTSQGYMFVQPDAQGNPIPLAGEDGKPFILNLEKLAPRLAPRVPGTYRGY
jgi:Transglycosylase SLT domain